MQSVVVASQIPKHPDDLEDDAQVAVKVQRPRIGEAIASDMVLLRRFISNLDAAMPRVRCSMHDTGAVSCALEGPCLAVLTSATFAGVSRTVEHTYNGLRLCLSKHSFQLEWSERHGSVRDHWSVDYVNISIMSETN